MAKVVRGVDDYKKEFLRLFDSLCGKYSRWEVWSDFIQLTAIDMSNATDKVNAPKRMETGKTIRKKYRDADMETMGNMLMQLVYGMDADTDQDFLGELYMACNLGNDHAGQFFTPYNVCQCMSEITYDVPALLDGKGFIAVNDPACGAGALLLSFANICKRKGINYQEKVLFVAQDIDYTVGLMCYIQLSLMGCAGYVVIGDTLINPCTAYDKKGLLPAGDPERIWFTPLFSDGMPDLAGYIDTTTGKIQGGTTALRGYANDDGVSDDLQVTLQDRDKIWMKSWLNEMVNAAAGDALKIRAKIWINYWNGYDVEEFLDCGEFELDSVSLSGPPNTVTIKACSLPFTSQIRQTKKSKAWENYSLSAILAEIAGANGMGYFFDTPNDPFYDRVEQSKEVPATSAETTTGEAADDADGSHTPQQTTAREPLPLDMNTVTLTLWSIE